MASKIYGSWGNVQKLLANLDKDIIKGSEELAYREAQNIESGVKEKILAQTESWSPLKDDTVKEKGHNKALYETGELVNSINAKEIHSLKYLISPEGTHSPSGLSNSELATIHEYGTSKIPPRPFIQPTHSEHKKDVEQKMVELVKKSISKYR